ncbi:neuronal acetylcholine receptor subunit alpha-7-like, partial [Notothenia coriiceps]|uniref:Neuronal acetylcholine receptor subunit alpha-7-like n=1 Tax=Notothenia coriiceps TaxID=8208 RepID=A0A6I9NL64_9TELE
YWTDIYLAWNPDNYPGVQNLRFPSNQVWVPDILLYNSADERFDATFHTNVLVNYSGSCQYIPPGILKSTCYIDVRWFPFDVQKCDLKFGSWTHNGWLLDLQMIEADISSYIPNGEWDLVGMKKNRH